MKLLFLVFLICPIVWANEPISYKDYKVVEFKIETEGQLKAAKNMEMMSGFKYWESPVQTNMKTELIIHPQMFNEFVEIAEENGIKFEILTEDLGSEFMAERPVRRTKDDSFAFDRYNTYEQILEFMDQIQSEFPENSQIFTIGNTFEGRPIKGIRITKNIQNPAIFIESNIHAREWITSATSVWLIDQFLRSSNETVRSFVDGITWYIIPVLNADGYEYSYNVDRLWRKTRSTLGSILCYGADPNRNFGFNWMNGGASAVPCTDTYGGVSAFSEPETKALIDFYATIYEKVKIFLSFHSATQALLYPWGDLRPRAPNTDDLFAVAEAAINALTARHGTDYVYGNTVDILYVASGTTPDHIYGVYNTTLAYTYEMRHANTGSRFVLPPEQIIPNAEEILESIMGMVAKATELNYF
ncbi:hypothetical protein ACKWTF_015248 [Chironomus riparius]